MAETIPGEDDRQHLDGEAALQKIRGLLKEFRSAMLTTVANGQVHSRPMGLQGDLDRFEGTLWFFADERSHKVDQLRASPIASLIFQKDEDNAYLHLIGRASTVHNRATMNELYTPLVKTWFPGGLDDPNLTLIRFDVDRGQFWESPGGMVQVLAAFAKSVVTGSPGSGGNVGEVRL